MRLLLSGSMSRIDAQEALAAELRAAGHEAEAPAHEEDATLASRLARRSPTERKAVLVADHLDRLSADDVLLVANLGPAGRVGDSALAEAGMAFALGRPILLLHDVADPSRAEVLASMGARSLGGDVAALRVGIRGPGA